MDKIKKIAEELGKAIAETPQFTELKKLELEARTDKELSTMTAEYQAILQHIANLEKNQQPVEIEDKQKFTEMREKVLSNPKIQTLLKIQTEYTELMSNVNRLIAAPLRIEVPKEAASEDKKD